MTLQFGVIAILAAICVVLVDFIIGQMKSVDRRCDQQQFDETEGEQ